ncbi:MAG: MarR family transcriptional regulator, partial [Candidatus Lokiarchaeota archaeon]|nr:MarR family transcriptional regulator [Candidatus Lokiarchaeota archaeon]
KLSLSSTSMIYPAIDELLKLEMIEDETIKRRGFRRYLNLTEKGKNILEKLKEIEALL